MLQSSNSIFVSRIELFLSDNNFAMKSVLLATCLLLAVSAIQGDMLDAYLEKAKDVVLTCGKENGLTGQSARDVFEEDAKSVGDKASCVQACVMKSLGTLKDSKVNLDKINDFIKAVHSDQPQLLKDLEKKAAVCADKVKDMSDDCKIAFAYVQCYFDKE